MGNLPTRLEGPGIFCFRDGDRSAAGDTASISAGTSATARGHRPRPFLGSEPAPSLSWSRVGRPPPRCLIRGGLRAGPPVSMAIGGCFSPLPFSAAAGEQPQPARRHRGCCTGAPDRAGGTQGGGEGELRPLPGQQIASSRSHCMAAMQPPEAGRAGGGECQDLIYFMPPKSYPPLIKPLFHQTRFPCGGFPQPGRKAGGPSLPVRFPHALVTTSEMSALS